MKIEQIREWSQLYAEGRRPPKPHRPPQRAPKRRAASTRQKVYLLYLLDKRGRSRDEVDVLKLSRREASEMIDRLKEETP